jgi:hypothetical protein
VELLTKREKLWLVCVGIVIELAILASMALPQELVLFDRTSAAVMLTWDANTEPDMARYTVYTWRGDTATAALTVPHPAGTATLDLAVRWQYERIGFTLTATDEAGNESAHSNKVVAVFSPTPQLVGDVDGDSLVTVTDGEWIRASYGALPWYAGWRAAADLDGSRKIDVVDLELLRTKLGNR